MNLGLVEEGKRLRDAVGECPHGGQELLTIDRRQRRDERSRGDAVA